MILKRIVYAFFLTVALFGPISVGADQQDPLFDQLDTDRDGFISRTESSKDERIAERFERLDVNKDDRLDKVEFGSLEEIDKAPKPTP